LILYLHEDEPQTLYHLLPEERWFDNRESLENCQENACDPFLALLFWVDKGEGLGLKIRKEIQFQGIKGESCRAYGSLPLFFLSRAVQPGPAQGS
jgi:hypothetical protein